MASTTLRELNGLDETPGTLADATLVLIDYQNTYTTGVLELTGWEAALDSAAALLARARKAGTKIIHVVNDGGEGTPYDIKAEIGRIHPRVAPIDGEPVVVKTAAPNAFIGTDLDKHIDAAGNKNLIVAGFMTNMCVLFTVEEAFLRGNHPTVVADAGATRALTTAGIEIPAEQIHYGALASITELYGVVVPSGASLR